MSNFHWKSQGYCRGEVTIDSSMARSLTDVPLSFSYTDVGRSDICRISILNTATLMIDDTEGHAVSSTSGDPLIGPNTFEVVGNENIKRLKMIAADQPVSVSIQLRRFV